MDYRKEIAEMINRIRSEKILRYIYLFIADIYTKATTPPGRTLSKVFAKK